MRAVAEMPRLSEEMMREAAELTWVEDYVWANLGWLFCEISFQSPDFVWKYLFFPSWCHSLGNYFYGRAYERVEGKSDG